MCERGGGQDGRPGRARGVRRAGERAAPRAVLGPQLTLARVQRAAQVRKMAALIRQAAKMYQKAVHTSLAQYGLRYEDLLNECNPDVEKALKYLPKDECV